MFEFTSNEDYAELKNEFGDFLKPYNDAAVDFVESIPESDIEGSVPHDLRGTLIKNGGGQFKGYKNGICHPFDGDAYVVSVQFGDQQTVCKGMFVQTPTRVVEENCKQRRFPGIGSPLANCSIKNLYPFLFFKDNPSIDIKYFNKKAYCFSELSSPYEVNPASLETIGKTIPKNISSIFSGHGRVTPESDALVFFKISYDLLSPVYSVHSISENGDINTVASWREDWSHVYCHDLLVDRDYIVLYLPPVGFSALDALLPTSKTGFELLKWKPNYPGKLVVIDRKSGSQRVIEIQDGPKFCFHLINFFFQDDLLQIGLIAYDRPEGFADHQAKLSRLQIDCENKVVHQSDLSLSGHEFPLVPAHLFGKDSEYFYDIFAPLGSASSFLNQGGKVNKINYKTGEVQSYFDPKNPCIFYEPNFVRKKRLKIRR